MLITKYAMYSYEQPLHTLHHKICHVFFLTAPPLCSEQTMPYILIHSHSTIFTRKYAMNSSTQPLHNAHYKNKQCIPTKSHSTRLASEYATYPSSQQFHTAHNKICRVSLLKATPNCSLKNMTFILPHSHSTQITTKYAMYS